MPEIAATEGLTIPVWHALNRRAVSGGDSVAGAEDRDSGQNGKAPSTKLLIAQPLRRPISVCPSSPPHTSPLHHPVFAPSSQISDMSASPPPTATGSSKVDAAKAALAAKVDPAAPTGLDLYSRFAFAGAVCCSVTHGALTPVDVVKTRIQLDPVTYNSGLIGGFRQIIAKDGAGALLTGLGPTAAGYFLQGAFKFGGYELFKQQSINLLGYETASNNRTAVYLASAACAEFFADIALCPLEATRIRLVSEPTFANGLIGGFSKILKNEGVGAFYSGFGPILFKQVPYTMAKFAVFEKVNEAIYKVVDKSQTSNGMQTVYNLSSGIIAGFAAAIISQPADTMLSKINKSKGLPGEGTTSRLIKIAKELGLKGSFSGIGARLFMVGTLTAGQFAIYGDIKKALSATGGVEIAKA
ncbi:mitochondrial phosphate carrier protein [Plenodomus biglobosus]|nr:mitochondrial phosphate carrier protein [Plenodomus biglobosus]